MGCTIGHVEKCIAGLATVNSNHACLLRTNLAKMPIFKLYMRKHLTNGKL